MQAELHLVDAFTRSAFSGNTAGACIPDGPAEVAWMQQVAAELKHSETVFLFPDGANWKLRWGVHSRGGSGIVRSCYTRRCIGALGDRPSFPGETCHL